MFPKFLLSCLNPFLEIKLNFEINYCNITITYVLNFNKTTKIVKKLVKNIKQQQMRTMQLRI